MTYVAYDTEKGGYRSPTSLKAYPTPQKGKGYKRLSAAIELGSLLNTPRNIPPGVPGPNKHYSNRPQVVVREFDANWELIATHAAPPTYLAIDTVAQTVTTIKMP
jgi:hypothetical protein